MSPEWVMVGVTVITVVVGMVWNVYTVDEGNKKMISAIQTGQEVAKVREDQHSKDILEIKETLKTISDSESLCRLTFEGRISKVEQKTVSIQSELSELKGVH